MNNDIDRERHPKVVKSKVLNDVGIDDIDIDGLDDLDYTTKKKLSTIIINIKDKAECASSYGRKLKELKAQLGV